MKKHLWLLAFCSTAQAGQVLLEQVEYQHFQSAEKNSVFPALFNSGAL